MAASAVVLIAAAAVAQKPEDATIDKSAANDKSAVEANKAEFDSPFGKDRPYVIEGPDILSIKVAKLVPKAPQRIDKLDTLRVAVGGTLVEMPILGSYKVDASGNVDLGFEYGKVSVVSLTEANAAKAVDEHLRTLLREPRVALSIEKKGEQLHIKGAHLVGPDGNINLGVFGATYVNGLTLDEARNAIEKKLSARFDEVSIALDVFAYNSKVYYVIEDNCEGGDRVTRLPITGNETVLDALANIKALRIREGTQIWVSRFGKVVGKKGGGEKQGEDQKLVVDWNAIVRGADTKSNYALLPGDRVFVVEPGPAREAKDSPRR